MAKNITIETPEIIVDPFENNTELVDPFENVSNEYEYKEPTFGEKAGAAAYGTATGLAGGLGELEKFGAYTVPDFARKIFKKEPSPRENMGFGRETLFPTVEEVRKGLGKIGIDRPREEVSGYETAGEIVGGFGTAIPGLVRGAVRGIVGTTTKIGEETAKRAEQLGFKLSPAQVRQDIPLTAKGATGFANENQTLANKLSSKATGRESAEISPEFVRERLNTLGGEFQNLYKDKVFNIDQDAVDALRQIANVENLLPPSVQVGAVKNTANNILEKFQTYSLRPNAIPGKFGVEGNQLQRIRTDLLQAARSSSSRTDAHAIYELVDAIDSSVARNHPQIAAKLSELRPLYRNTIILEDLVRNGGIRQGNISLESLGNMLGARKEGVRRVQGELDKLGQLGRELKLRARWQTAGDTEEKLSDLARALKTPLNAGASALGLRSRPARAIQRRLGEAAEAGPKEFRYITPARTAKEVAAGTATRPLNKNEEE
jgi:hypothetical protein